MPMTMPTHLACERPTVRSTAQSSDRAVPMCQSRRANRAPEKSKLRCGRAGEGKAGQNARHQVFARRAAEQVSDSIGPRCGGGGAVKVEDAALAFLANGFGDAIAAAQKQQAANAGQQHIQSSKRHRAGLWRPRTEARRRFRATRRSASMTKLGRPQPTPRLGNQDRVSDKTDDGLARDTLPLETCKKMSCKFEVISRYSATRKSF